MGIFALTREIETGVLTVIAVVNGTQKLKLILDTGATVTTIDSNLL